ncbi:MAG: histidine kinase, partial [Chloroflexota bacterium]|nr:histidine kinase [Chloroflexota bacterium]
RAAPRPGPAAARDLFAAQQETQVLRTAWDSLLEHLPVGVVVVDARYDIQDINLVARRLLSIHTPAIGEDFVHLAQHIAPRPLRAAIDRTLRSGEVSSLDEVEVPHVTTGEPLYLRITCYPHPIGEETPVTALIQVVDVTAGVKAGQELAQARTALAAQAGALAETTADLESVRARLARQNEEGARLTADLAAAQRHAEVAVGQHTRQMERLVDTNRDVLAANEELAHANTALRALSDRAQLNAEQAQAAIEESETLNEELQASNEEQETLNEQLQAAIEELNTSNADLAARGEDLGRMTTAQGKLQQRLLHGAIQAQEDERRRVARDLHDDIGQSLTALALVLGVIQTNLPEPGAPAQRILADGMVLVENMMGGLRRVIADLRPPVLDDLGLVPALRRLASDLQQRAAIAVVVEADDDSARLPQEVELTLFRVAQEALANIGKHANARNATILLTQDRRHVRLVIEDDGRGLQRGVAAAPGAAFPMDRGSFGLLGMRERVLLLNGVFRIEDAPQRGTRIVVELPPVR